MKFFYLILLTHFVFLSTINAQSHFKGRVLDDYSDIAVSSATITIGGSTTITDKDGYFSVDAETELPATLKVSHVSYENRSVSVKSDQVFILIRISRKIAELEQVIVTTPGDALQIIEKANAAICKNYPRKKFRQQGYHIASESYNTDGFILEDTAVVTSIIPSYCGDENTILKVEQNKRTVQIKDSGLLKLKDISGGYYFVSGTDYVKKGIFAGPNLKTFQFSRKKDSVNADLSALYVIAFRNKNQETDQFSGTIYIDKKTLAYVAFIINAVKAPKRTTEIAIDKEYITIEIRYQRQKDGYFYLQSFKNLNTRNQRLSSNRYSTAMASKLQQQYAVFSTSKKAGSIRNKDRIDETIRFWAVNKPKIITPWATIEELVNSLNR